jgi:hypothetical protein
MAEYKERRKATSFTHRFLWKGCLKQKEIADQKSPGYISFNLTTMLLAFMSLEAYVNFIGELIFAGNETEFFYTKNNRFRSFNSKFDLITEKCRVNIDKAQRPYNTIRTLKELRNFVAHGRTEKSEYEVKYKENELPPPQRTYLASLVHTDAMLTAIEDIKAICDLIHAQVKSFCDQPNLGSDALEGMLFFEIGDTEPVP